jgi:hypothetical protein
MAVSLGEKTADATIWTGAGQLAAITVITDATNTATVIIYDNTAASGKKIFEAAVLPAVDLAKHFDFASPIRFEIGMTLDITGTGASCIPYVA